MSDNERRPLPSYVLERIPLIEVCNAALALARDALPEPIFNHSLRVFLLAKWLAQAEGSEWSSPSKAALVFVAAVCHDLGASDLYNGKQRFEVEGADAAKKHLLSYGTRPEQSHQVWVAIALHTSPGIAERIDPLARLIRLGVKIDFSPALRDQRNATDFSAEIEVHLPRLDIERVLSDAVVKQAGTCLESVDSMTWPSSEKHPSSSWPGILLRAHLENPGYDGVNPAF